MMNYYNTNKLKNPELNSASKKAKTQKKEVKIMFLTAIDRGWTASEIWLDKFKDRGVPITSIRRALSDLTNDNFIYKTEYTKQGYYNAPEHIYKIDDHKSQRNLF